MAAPPAASTSGKGAKTPAKPADKPSVAAPAAPAAAAEKVVEKQAAASAAAAPAKGAPKPVKKPAVAPAQPPAETPKVTRRRAAADAALSDAKKLAKPAISAADAAAIAAQAQDMAAATAKAHRDAHARKKASGLVKPVAEKAPVSTPEASAPVRRTTDRLAASLEAERNTKNQAMTMSKAPSFPVMHPSSSSSASLATPGSYADAVRSSSPSRSPSRSSSPGTGTEDRDVTMVADAEYIKCMQDLSDSVSALDLSSSGMSSRNSSPPLVFKKGLMASRHAPTSDADLLREVQAAIAAERDQLQRDQAEMA